MNFTIKEDIQEKKIVQSVFDKNNGDDETYKKYISDTEEAKNLIMTDFLQSKFKTYDDVTGWFVENYNGIICFKLAKIPKKIVSL